MRSFACLSAPSFSECNPGESNVTLCNGKNSAFNSTGFGGTDADVARYEEVTGKDASWILTTAVIIFTMQTGFGLLEAGCVSAKNEVNIMMKNALDVVFGGITYWAFGFGLSFGADKGSNEFVGMGCFFVDADKFSMGYVFAVFLFQLSFATTATTIVSGAMAERTKLSAYLLFSFLNTTIYCMPAHWLWAEQGFLQKWGAVDVAGCGPVHLVGGMTGLVATLQLGARKDINFRVKSKPPLPSPLKAILGMFMLWWGWIRFSSGSVFIMSSNTHWKLAVRAGVTTIIASMAGGMTGVFISVLTRWLCKSRSRFDVAMVVNGVLGSLVSVTSICTLCKPWEALVIGSTGAVIASVMDAVLWKLRIDDPVGVISVHGACGAWGIITVGLFLEKGDGSLKDQGGLLKTGQWYMLGIQSLSAVIIIAWTILISFLMLKAIDMTLGIRLSPEDEEIGADAAEHGLTGFSLHDVLDNRISNDFTLVKNVDQETDLHKHIISIFAELGNMPNITLQDWSTKVINIRLCLQKTQDEDYRDSDTNDGSKIMCNFPIENGVKETICKINNTEEISDNPKEVDTFV